MARVRSEQERSRRRVLTAAAAALLAHALLALFVLRLEAPRPHRSTPITVELRPVTRHDDPPAPKQPGERPHRRTPRLPSRTADSLRPDLPVSPRAGGEGSGIGGVANLPENKPEATAPSPAVRPFAEEALEESAHRFAAEHAAGDGGGEGGPTPGGIGETPGAGRGAGTGDGDGPEAERARVSGRVTRDLDDTAARSRVDAGLVDPYFRDLRFGLKDSWKPSKSLVGGDEGDSVGAAIANMVRSWSAAGRQYASTGSPFPTGETATGLLPTRETMRSAGGTSGFDAADYMARWNGGEFAFLGGAVVVQLTQDAEGRALKVEVLVSSGRRLLDDSAREAVTALAAEKLPPAHGLGLGGKQIRSVWKLDAKLVPYSCALAPDASGLGNNLMCGGTFDPSLGVLEVQKPGSSKVVTAVTLLAVYGGETGPHAP